MSSLLTTGALNPKESFWQRQFSTSSTLLQTVFDVMFGILMPVICFYLDPGIVRGNPSNGPIFIYTFSLISILSLAVWLVLSHRAKASTGIFAGVLLSGAVCSFIIGVAILPLTLIGMFLVIGLLGFVPFITAFVYLRNAVRAIDRGNAVLNWPKLITAVIASALLVVGMAASVHWKVTKIVEQSMSEVLSGNPGSAEAAIQRMRYFRAIVDTDRIVRKYEQETDSYRKERLAQAYKDITGDDLETRQAKLND